jgi:hypothetical protein
VEQRRASPTAPLRCSPAAVATRRRGRRSAAAGGSSPAFGTAAPAGSCPAPPCFLLAAAAGGAAPAALLHLGGRRGARGGGDEEVDAPALEPGVGRHDGDLPGAARGPRRGERVAGVRGEDGGGGERAGELVHVPAEVHDADQVQRAAGEHARQAAAQAVPHGFLVATWNTPPAARFARACVRSFTLSLAWLFLGRYCMMREGATRGKVGGVYIELFRAVYHGVS